MVRTFALLLILLLPTLPAAAADEVTIYRCVGANGKLTLRDSPCAKGETQQVRSMQRPRDPAPGPAPEVKPEPPEPAPTPRREVQVVYRTPPRPMYECVTPDDKRYTSDNGEGNPRWVPLWTVAWPYRSRGPGHPDGRPGGPDRPERPAPSSVAGFIPGGGSWIRDECHPLPQQEVCARLSDRRYEIMRRYNSAMQGERRQLDLEQRGIDARLSNDCGIN